MIHLPADPKAPVGKTSAGRPREFDIDQALSAAVLVFRERGFSAGSIGELSKATGLTTGSLYKAFPDKKSWFLAALDQYASQRSAQLQALIGRERTGLDKLGALLAFYARSAHGLEGRRGCLVISAIEEISILDAEVAGAVAALADRNRDLILSLVGEGQADGSVCSDRPAVALAEAVFAFTQGLRILGKLGRDSAEAQAMADVALAMLRPTPSVSSNDLEASPFPREPS